MGALCFEIRGYQRRITEIVRDRIEPWCRREIPRASKIKEVYLGRISYKKRINKFMKLCLHLEPGHLA